jgi:hypothetical protein
VRLAIAANHGVRARISAWNGVGPFGGVCVKPSTMAVDSCGLFVEAMPKK